MSVPPYMMSVPLSMMSVPLYMMSSPLFLYMSYPHLYNALPNYLSETKLGTNSHTAAQPHQSHQLRWCPPKNCRIHAKLRRYSHVS